MPSVMLYREFFDKNAIDKDEYPKTAAVECYCWRIPADRQRVPDILTSRPILA